MKLNNNQKECAFELLQERLFEITNINIHDGIQINYDYEQEAMLIASNIGFKGFNLEVLKYLLQNRNSIEATNFIVARNLLISMNRCRDRCRESGDN